MENSINVRLSDNTVGFCVDTAKVGDIVDCWLHDENGMLISVIGEIEEIL